MLTDPHAPVSGIPDYGAPVHDDRISGREQQHKSGAQSNLILCGQAEFSRTYRRGSYSTCLRQAPRRGRLMLERRYARRKSAAETAKPSYGPATNELVTRKT